MAKNLLQQHFPMFSLCAEVEAHIKNNPKFNSIFEEKDANRQKELLNYCTNFFVPLDMFRKNIQNKSIRTKSDAWLVFLTSDELELLTALLQNHPEFQVMYEEIVTAQAGLVQEVAG